MLKDSPASEPLIGRRLGEQVRDAVDRVEQDATAIGLRHEAEGTDMLHVDHVVFTVRDRRPNRTPHAPRFDRHGLQRIGPVGQMAERGQPVQAGDTERRQDIDRVPLAERSQEQPRANRDR